MVCLLYFYYLTKLNNNIMHKHTIHITCNIYFMILLLQTNQTNQSTHQNWICIYMCTEMTNTLKEIAHPAESVSIAIMDWAFPSCPRFDRSVLFGCWALVFCWISLGGASSLTENKLTKALQASMPSPQVYPKFKSSSSPHSPNQAPSRAQQLIWPVCIITAHLGHTVLTSAVTGIPGVNEDRILTTYIRRYRCNSGNV